MRRRHPPKDQSKFARQSSYGFSEVTTAPRPPIFILGVPRSGTTLLRTILDGHSAIAAGPETPWLSGHQPRSLMGLWSALRDEPWGYCKSFNMPADVATDAARAFMAVLMDRYCLARGKTRWAEKTPDNALYVPFLLNLFPDARFVHLVRDGLDTAMSTSVVAPHRKGISVFLEKNLGFGPGVPPVDNTPFAAVLRWNHWNDLIRQSLTGRKHLAMSYERLVTEPTATVQELMEFVNEPFEPAMLDYAKARHDFPAWEWGSADVKSRGAIGSESVGRGKRELDPIQLGHLAPIVQRGPIANTFAGARANLVPSSDVLASWIQDFARPMGLEVPDPGTHAAIAWLWHNGLPGIGKMRLRVIGSSAHPLPWILALLGARVSFAGAPADEKLRRLAASLKVDVTWQDAAADAVLALSGLEGDDPDPRVPAFVLGPVGANRANRVSAALPADSDGLGASILAPA